MNTASERLTLIFEIDKERPFVVKIYFNIKNDRATKNILFSFIDIFECQEKNIEESKNKFTIKLCDYKNDINNFYSNSLNVEKKKKENIKWAAFMQKYFTTGLYFKNTNNDTNIHIAPGTDNIEKKTSITTEFRDCNNVDLEYYFGPNSLKELKTLNSNFDEIMYYGIPGVRVFNKYIVLPLVKIFEKKNVNIGIIIILLVLLLKILLLPLNLKSYKTIAKMKQINPLLKELNEKYGEDKQRLAFEQINLYRKYGVNPLGSLVPLLLQFPFLIAMFNFIPIEISFRNKSFLWCNDMSTYDSILNLGFNIPFYGDHISLFALLMTLTTVLYSLYSMSSESSKSSFWITIFIPLFFLGISNRFCGALNFYYLIFNIITLIIQFFIKKFFIKDTDIKKNYLYK
jgi:YidC/Oxa1 family membrane protein insertase